MWNTLSIHSSTELNLILNDDLTINSNHIFNYMSSIQQLDVIRTINGSFSHFITSKKTLEDISFFDERFLGFGEEDGDIIYRHIETLNKIVDNTHIGGIENIQSDIKDNTVAVGRHPRYTKFNEDFAFGPIGPKYTPTATPKIITGFVPHQIKSMDDEKQYPYESFFRKYKTNL